MQVKSWIQCADIESHMVSNDMPANSHYFPDVLNGIAYDPETKRLWLTGKRWPKVCVCAFCSCLSEC